ncbi:MAG: CLC_0170 family protein [Clostridium sp.]
MSLKVIIQSMFDLGSLIIFLSCAGVLLFIDCKDYKKQGMVREHKVAKVFGLLFIIGGTSMFVIMKFFIR